MENEIMMNEEVMETAAEAVEMTGASKATKIAIGIGLVALVGGVAYKYAIKPIAKKIKAKKAQKKADAEVSEDLEENEIEYDVED